jgi:two-component system KDP operon response regulator KdpE
MTPAQTNLGGNHDPSRTQECRTSTNAGRGMRGCPPEPQIRKLLRVTLEAHGYSIVEAGTGKDGIIQASMSRPDVVVLDLGLPDIDGTQVLLQIRECSNVPIIVLTVRDDEAVKVFALDNGADDYVTKPFQHA